MIKLKSCPKVYTTDQDKAVSPEETVARVKGLLKEKCDGVLGCTRKIDTGRLGIPVFISECGPAAREIMPTRKQMGKGASIAQAEASALMELVERFSFFSFWSNAENFTLATYSEAEELWPGKVISIEKILQSVDEKMDPAKARVILDLVRWHFHPALNVLTGEAEYVPLDWFKILNEFNGSSAGNTPEESVLQGGSELVERHVCAVIDSERLEVPRIDPATCEDEVLAKLCKCFEDNGIKYIISDFSLGMPLPTVAVTAWDPSTFPGMSEIVFTAGTSSCPSKAAIRAFTEVAQLAGDFETGRVYEASGLPKFTDLDQAEWLTKGKSTSINDLPNVLDSDIYDELIQFSKGLDDQGYTLYTVDTTHPDLGVSANYNFVPGFRFRERTPHASLGLFVGRILSEKVAIDIAGDGLDVISDIYDDDYFIPFFEGMLALRGGDTSRAADMFKLAIEVQPADEEKALSAFYAAYALSLEERWVETIPYLDRAIELDNEAKEFFNLRGVAKFKAGEYAIASEDFKSALAIDNGSASDLANLGLCHKFMGNTEEAIEYLSTAIELEPELEYARTHLEQMLNMK
ncbi:YcaO-like family protein [Maridesulfovibrio frigidus]|uniref:YcaO-like family protein n=1 Tax=Maridesulfovibrio frigidus TaxID=340956 RepID=UPI0004E18655|nr:YcaO-like family protein [Maridesulfovibrio frigidus]